MTKKQQQLEADAAAWRRVRRVVKAKRIGPMMPAVYRAIGVEIERESKATQTTFSKKFKPKV